MSINPNVVNIVELQNVVTSVTGTSGTQQLQNDVDDIKKMVNFSEKQILADIITSYSGGIINVTSPVFFQSTVYATAVTTISTIS